MSRWRMLLLALLAVVSLGAMPAISSAIASRLLTSSGAVLAIGSVADGEALVRSGSTVTSLAVAGADAGLTSLESCDAGAGLCYPSAANTWTRQTMAADQGFYSSSSSAIAQYSLTAGGRALAGLTGAADAIPYWTSSSAATTATTSSFGRSLWDDANAAAGRTTLGVVPGTDVQGYDADLTTWASLTPTSAFQTLVDDSSIAAIQTTLGGGLGRTAITHVTTTAPTTGDDSADGYAVGDLWSDTTGNTTYIADSVSVGAADWRSLLSSGPLALCVTVSGGNPCWYEAAWNGAGWTASTACTTLTTETDGGATFAGTTMTLPLGTAFTAATQSSANEYYVNVSSASAAYQALVVAGSRMWLDVNPGTLSDTTNARIGVAVTKTSGTAFDASSENICAWRGGQTATNPGGGVSCGTSAFTADWTAATYSYTDATWFGGGTAVAVAANVSATPAYSAKTGVVGIADRIYLLGAASTANLLLPADFAGFNACYAASPR